MLKINTAKPSFHPPSPLTPMVEEGACEILAASSPAKAQEGKMPLVVPDMGAGPPFQCHSSLSRETQLKLGAVERLAGMS